MTRRTRMIYLGIPIAMLIAGLALGAGRSDEDTSALNTASKLLLTLGLLGLVATTAIALIRRRARRPATTTRQVTNDSK